MKEILPIVLKESKVSQEAQREHQDHPDITDQEVAVQGDQDRVHQEDLALDHVLVGDLDLQHESVIVEIPVHEADDVHIQGIYFCHFTYFNHLCHIFFCCLSIYEFKKNQPDYAD